MCLPLRFKNNYRGPHKHSLFFPYNWDLCGFRHTGLCIVMPPPLISRFPRTADGPVLTLVSWSRNPLSAPFFHVEFRAWFSLCSVPRAALSWPAGDSLLKALRMRTVAEGTEQQRHTYWMVGLICPSAWQHFLLDPFLGPCRSGLSKSTTPYFSHFPLSLTPLISLHFLIPQAQNSFSWDLKPALSLLFVCLF